MGYFREIPTGPSTYCPDLPLSMAAVQPWFHTYLLKPAGPQPAGPPALKDDSYEVKSIFKLTSVKHMLK